MAIDLSNPVKKDEWARSQGYSGWNEYQLYNPGADPNSQSSLGSSSSSPSINLPTVDEYIKSIVDLMPSAPERYDKANPFAFDEQAARDIAEAEFSPYYDELLSDYLEDVGTTKERVGEDQQQFLAELDAQKDYFTETQGKNLDRMIRGIKEGYSGRGLYFSGEKNRDVSEAQQDTQAAIENYMTGYGFDVTGSERDTQRKLEDIAKGTTRYTRDLGREETAAIEGNVLQQRGEQLNQYNLGRQQYYQNANWGSLL